MPRNASGVYTQPASDVNPPVAGTVIDPIAFANALTDISTELTNSLDRQGRGAMQAPLAMGGFRATGLGAAVASTDAARLSDVQGYLPSGAIIMHAAATPPTGWLECNGNAVSRVTYAALFVAIATTWGAGDGSTTFNVPDFRGYFPRGYDNGAGIDPARVFGSLQADGFKTHTHTQNAHNHGVTDPTHNHQYNQPIGSAAFAGGGTVAQNTTSPTLTTASATNISIQNTTAVNQSTGGTETVPKNKACLFIIRT